MTLPTRSFDLHCVRAFTRDVVFRLHPTYTHGAVKDPGRIGRTNSVMLRGRGGARGRAVYSLPSISPRAYRSANSFSATPDRARRTRTCACPLSWSGHPCATYP